MNAHTNITPEDGPPAGQPKRHFDIEGMVYDLMRASIALDEFVELKFRASRLTLQDGHSFEMGQDCCDAIEFLTNCIRQKAFELNYRFTEELRENGYVS